MVVYRPVNYLVKLSISMDNIITNFQFFIQSHLSTMVIPSRYYYIHILTQSREKIFAMDIRIKDGNKAYIISYSAEQPEYDTYLATIEKMINSFRTIQVD